MFKCYSLGLVPMKGKGGHTLVIKMLRFHSLNKDWNMACLFVCFLWGEKPGFCSYQSSAVTFFNHQSNVSYSEKPRLPPCLLFLCLSP